MSEIGKAPHNGSNNIIITGNFITDWKNPYSKTHHKNQGIEEFNLWKLELYYIFKEQIRFRST